MKKLLILVVGLCGLQFSAQGVEADSVEVSATVKTSDSVSAPTSCLLLEMMLQSIEDDYDMIWDRIAPDVVIALRCNEFFAVNIMTGEEHLLPHYGEDEKDEATSQKRQNADSEQQKTDSDKSDFDDE